MIIPIVFAFDNNFAKPAFVAIASLFHYANKKTEYKVYCIISEDVSQDNKDLIKKLENKRSSIVFLNADNDYDKAHQHRQITTASYYRLMLHKLIPNEDKIIYSDVDVLFHGDLTKVYNTDISNNVLAGVKNLYIYQVFEKHLLNINYWSDIFGDSKYTYINAGFVLMNLEVIRKTKIWEDWISLAKEKWEYHDQDILNLSCKNKIIFIPPKYNATYPIRSKGADRWDLFTKEELTQKPIVLHYTAAKPWNAKFMKQADEWWCFVKQHTTLYPYFLKNYRQKETLNVKFKRLLRKVISKLNRITDKIITKNK